MHEGREPGNTARQSVLRSRIERLTARTGETAAASPRIALLLVLAITAGLGAGLTRLEIETDAQDMLRAEDPVRRAYDAFRYRFGREDAIVIAISAPSRVFEHSFLRRLQALHADLETELPHLDEVTSLINVRDTRAEGDRIRVEPFLAELPESQEALRTLEERALANPVYRNWLLSSDGDFTALLVTPLASSSEMSETDALAGFDEAPPGEVPPEPVAAPMTREQNAELVAAIRGVAGRHDGPEFRLHLAGGPLTAEVLQAGMERDLGLFLTLAIVIVALLLFVIFRRLSAVFVPLAVVGLSLVATVGAMGWLGVALSVGTQILPSFLLTVGVGYTVHLLTLFYERLSAGGTRKAAVHHALERAGFAITMTALTTAAGLAAFAGSALKPVAQLGVMAPLGVLLSLLYTLLLVPPLLVLVPIRAPRTPGPAGGAGRAGRLLVRVGETSAAHPRAIVVLVGCLVAIALAGTAQLRFTYDPIGWLPADAPIVRASDAIDAKLGGTIPLELVVHAPQGVSFRDPAVLEKLDVFSAAVRAAEDGPVRVGKTLSVVDIVKEIHGVLSPESAEAGAIPESRNLVAKELLLFENSGSDDTREFVDALYSKARLSLLVERTDSIHFPAYLDTVTAQLESSLGPGFQVEATGLVAVLSRAITAVIESMSRSYLLAFAMVLPLMIFVLGSWRDGLTSMLPNLAPIAIALGAMGWLGIPIDVLAVLVGSIALGLVVDDTIHFFHSVRQREAAGMTTEQALRDTLLTTGRALLFTSLALSAGFFLFTLSSLGTLHRFGAVTSITILLAFVCDITLGPALVSLLRRPGNRTQEPASRVIH